MGIFVTGKSKRNLQAEKQSNDRAPSPQTQGCCTWEEWGAYLPLPPTLPSPMERRTKVRGSRESRGGWRALLSQAKCTPQREPRIWTPVTFADLGNTQPLVTSKGWNKLWRSEHFSLGHCQGLKDIKNREESHLPNVQKTVQNKNAGSCVQKAENSFINGTDL